MQKYLFILFTLSILFSCKKLAKAEFEVSEKAYVDQKQLKETIIEEEKGIYGVWLDTIERSLLVRYDAETIDSVQLTMKLEALGYIIQEEKLDSIALYSEIDTISILDTVPQPQVDDNGGSFSENLEPLDSITSEEECIDVH